MPMTVPDSFAYTARAAHDVGLAAWLGGAMFGKFAHNPSLVRITAHEERGAVANAAWNGYNVINTAGLAAAAFGWGSSRLTETAAANLTSTEQALSQAKDVLMGVSVATGLLSSIQGARLAKQAPDGAVPVETGTVPAPETPRTAARIQRSLGVLGNLNIAAGVSLVAVNAVLAQTSHSHPAKRRALTRSSTPGDSSTSPLWLAPAVTTVLAAVDEARRRAS
ncbi:unannotated protein [freshwater metagenome]|uniref:Unannotated protein n=1 Tax=freshwater metagenome TaxID=449393 RepID=A0A6J7IE73_9ZZZZ